MNTPWRALRNCGTSNGRSGVLGRERAVAPGVAARERDSALHQPVGELHAGPRLAGQVGVGVVPVLAPAGVEQHRVARRRIDVRDADHLSGLERGDVNEPAAGHDLGHRLDAEPLRPRGARELGDAPAVVAAIADLQMTEGVEMGAELLGAGDLLGDPVDAVCAQAAAVSCDVQW